MTKESGKATATTPFSGGCACGAILYESDAEPLAMLHCHCRDCQRSSGGPFSSFIILPKDTVRLLQGSLHFHDMPSEAGVRPIADFVATAVLQLWSGPTRNLRSLRSERPAWMIPVGSIRKWTSGHRTRIHGTT